MLAWRPTFAVGPVRRVTRCFLLSTPFVLWCGLRFGFCTTISSLYREGFRVLDLVTLRSSPIESVERPLDVAHAFFVAEAFRLHRWLPQPLRLLDTFDDETYVVELPVDFRPRCAQLYMSLLLGCKPSLGRVLPYLQDS